MHTHNYHPVTDYKDGIFNTLSGKQINLLNPTEDIICIKDIASSLSKLCRFNGHTSHFYSVAQHSILVAALAPMRLRKEALLHDATEAYLGDVISPLKHLLGASYKNLETNFEAVIAQKFSIKSSQESRQKIKEYDLQALELEHEWLQKGNDTFFSAAFSLMGLAGHSEQLAWGSSYAEIIFLTFFNKYSSEAFRG